MIARGRSVLGWLFRDRRTGLIVIAQFPNVPLLVWLGTSVLSWLLHPDGRWAIALTITARLALVVWAGGEILRGANPSRRILGAAVLGFVVVSWAV